MDALHWPGLETGACIGIEVCGDIGMIPGMRIGLPEFGLQFITNDSFDSYTYRVCRNLIPGTKNARNL